VYDASAGQFANFNTIYDGSGDDTLTGNNTGNTIIGGNGDDNITGGTGADFIRLGNGFNVVSCDGGADTVLGGGGHDVIYATDYLSDPMWYPNNLNTPASGKPGIEVFAGSGDTSVVGGPGNDTLVGGSGGCTMHGMAGNDYMVGGEGTSILFGDAGNDTIYGGSGDNYISGGSGQNVIYGGTVAGTHTFIDEMLPDMRFTSQQGETLDTDSYTMTAMDKGAALPAVPSSTFGPGSGDLIIGGSADTTVIGGNGNDTMRGGDGPTTLVAGNGYVLMIAGNGPTTMQGGGGEDTMVAGGAPDDMTGGAGNTVFLNLNGKADSVTGGAGFSVAEDDPTGQTTFTNIQVIYDPFNFIGNGGGRGFEGGIIHLHRDSEHRYHPGYDRKNYYGGAVECGDAGLFEREGYFGKHFRRPGS
jgi:Ca2+-binding RTX toxin-like protein